MAEPDENRSFVPTTQVVPNADHRFGYNGMTGAGRLGIRF